MKNTPVQQLHYPIRDQREVSHTDEGLGHIVLIGRIRRGAGNMSGYQIDCILDCVLDERTAVTYE